MCRQSTSVVDVQQVISSIVKCSIRHIINCRTVQESTALCAFTWLLKGLLVLQENGGAQQAGLLTLSKAEFHNSTVERLPWQGAAFSQDSEHMVGVTPEHKIYAWSLHTGKLEKFLEFEGEFSSPPAHPKSVLKISGMNIVQNKRG